MAKSNRTMSNTNFKVMSIMFKVRDMLQPRSDILKEAGIKPGFTVLDFGCGPGGYIVPLVKIVGSLGKIYALDVHPLAIHKVKKIAKQTKCDNISTIESDCDSGLPDNFVDIVILYDVFHDLIHPNKVLKEIHRILKTDGTLSFSNHHMMEKEVLTQVTGAGIFKFIRRGKKTYSFMKAD